MAFGICELRKSRDWFEFLFLPASCMCRVCLFVLFSLYVITVLV